MTDSAGLPARVVTRDSGFALSLNRAAPFPLVGRRTPNFPWLVFLYFCTWLAHLLGLVCSLMLWASHGCWCRVGRAGRDARVGRVYSSILHPLYASVLLRKTSKLLQTIYNCKSMYVTQSKTGSFFFVKLDIRLSIVASRLSISFPAY